MIPFRDISILDKDIILRYIAHSGRRNCDLSLSNLCSWSFYYNTQIAEYEGCLLFKFWAKGEVAYMMPVSDGNIRPAILALIDDAHREQQPFRMLGVCGYMKYQLEFLFHNSFDFLYDRDYDDYFYLRSDLASLTGKKYQPKRNFINRFKRNYEYHYVEITPEVNRIEECIALEAKWFEANNGIMDETSTAERKALTYALRHYQELGLTGGIVCVDGEAAAFSFGRPINHDTFCIHVEKANTAIEGSYAMINFEFANRVPPQYIYLNREEDLGKEGLRKTKLSYQPYALLKKYMACLKSEPTTMIKW